MRHGVQRLIWSARRALLLRPGNADEEIWRLGWLCNVPEGVAGSFKWRGVELRYSDARPAWRQLREIYSDRVYDFACESRRPRILDCGAHIGISVLRMRELFPSAEITAFEADPVIAEMLRANLAAAGDGTSEVIAEAAWTEDTTVRFRKTGSDNGHIDASAGDAVRARDLASFCRRPVDLLKLDIEGAEGRVIAHLESSGLLPNVRRLVCEWHQWTPAAPDLHVALKTLVDAGFVYRLVEAGCLGDMRAPAFPMLAWPGNHMLLYAWQPETEEIEVPK